MREKYGITDAHYLCDSAIFNTETDEILRLYQICDLLNQQDQRIAELEEQVKDCIRPKFKVGQEVWCIRFMEIIKFKINKVEIYRGEAEEENRIVYGNWEDMVYQIEGNCFATKEEAQAKMEEMGENK